MRFRHFTRAFRQHSGCHQVGRLIRQRTRPICRFPQDASPPDSFLGVLSPAENSKLLGELHSRFVRLQPVAFVVAQQRSFDSGRSTNPRPRTAPPAKLPASGFRAFLRNELPHPKACAGPARRTFPVSPRPPVELARPCSQKHGGSKQIRRSCPSLLPKRTILRSCLKEPRSQKLQSRQPRPRTPRRAHFPSESPPCPLFIASALCDFLLPFAPHFRLFWPVLFLVYRAAFCRGLPRIRTSPGPASGTP